MWIYRDKCPDERCEDEDDIDSCEKVVFEAKLKIGKGEVENEVQREWERDRPRERSFKELVKNRAKGDGNDSVQHRPHRPKNPARWRPGGLDERAIPVVSVGVHSIYILYPLLIPRAKESTLGIRLPRKYSPSFKS